jgi:Leucine-rich repeat (LRR) protein
LTNNDIEAISSELSGLQTLTQLILNGNKLEAIPGSIGFMKELRVLGVNENRLTEVRGSSLIEVSIICKHFVQDYNSKLNSSLSPTCANVSPSIPTSTSGS